jgi:hypothetical protein
MATKIPDLSPEQARAMFKRAEEEDAFWATHYREFRERYPDQYVIVQAGEVIGTARDLLEVEAFAKAKALDVRDLSIEFMADPDEPLVV